MGSVCLLVHFSYFLSQHFKFLRFFGVLVLSLKDTDFISYISAKISEYVRVCYLLKKRIQNGDSLKAILSG